MRSLHNLIVSCDNGLSCTTYLSKEAAIKALEESAKEFGWKMCNELSAGSDSAYAAVQPFSADFTQVLCHDPEAEEENEYRLDTVGCWIRLPDTCNGSRRELHIINRSDGLVVDYHVGGADKNPKLTLDATGIDSL